MLFFGFLHHEVFTNGLSETHGDNGFKWMPKGRGRRNVLGMQDGLKK